MSTHEHMRFLSSKPPSQDVLICKYSDIDWNIYRPKRAGIIVYIAGTMTIILHLA